MDPTLPKGEEKRTRVCAAEFICEVLGKEMTDKEYKYLARRVSKVIAKLPNWEKVSSTRHAERLYGIQRGFKRVDGFEEEDL